MDILMTFIITVTYMLLLLPFKLSIAADSIHLSQSLTYGKTLVSLDGTFELGFFRPDGNSNRTYLGIWFKKVPVRQVVWVANRVNPIIGSDDHIMLTVNSTGNFVLTQNSTVVWFTNIQKQAQTNPVAVLLDNGNLVVRNEGETNTEEEYLWQSFDYPSDTWLPEMKVGRSFKSGHDRKLTSWKSPEDPSPSDFTWGLALRDYPDSYIMKGTKIKLSRFGPWNGEYPSGVPEVRYTSSSTHLLGNRYEYVISKDEMFYRYTQSKNSVISIIVLNQTTLFRYVWIEQDQIWRTYRSFPKDYCDTYGLCGAYGNCIISRGEMCQCFKGFSPKSPQAITDWSEGCVRDKPLSCYNGTQKDGFIKFGGLRVPDTTHALLNESMSLEECRDKCLNNCSCMAYTNSNISGGGSGCVMWFGDLIDIRQFDDGGQDLYIRMSASMLGTEHGSERRVIIYIIIASICGLLVPCLYFVGRVRRKNAAETSQLADIDLPLFDLTTIAAATNGFSMNKKIGEGGFGPVYWGKLADGQEIAVKKLSSLSSQGMTEFINEVKLISQLQHRNLVKLLGCCIQGQERVLIYEYMDNGSLHSFIFDDIKGKLLKWPQRLHIIYGVCRGLVYLHQDSRLRIIHRDLKASNVLLDQDLNPKISDFGTARTFGGDWTEGNTKRIIGTYGYMAPEYVAKGIFSVKSDVFSFGILLLEIICGKRNKAYYHTDDNLNLVGQAWTLWKEGRALELIDSNIGDSYAVSEVLRCMHASLLCVQQNPNDRPTMTSVMLMLESEMELEEPKEPGFFYSNISPDSYLHRSQKDSSLAYDVTISSFGPR